MNKHLIGIAVFTLAAAAYAAAPANAADSAAPQLAHPVSFSDLDLTRTADAQTLYQRIKTAADAVCSPLDGAQIREKVNRSACVNDAIERAIKQVNEPLLTGYYLTLNPNSHLGTSLAAKR